VWDNFETVREMPDPTGATPPLDEAGLPPRLLGFLEWVRDHSSSAVIITSRGAGGLAGPGPPDPRRGLNRAEAAQYAGPSARLPPDRPASGETRPVVRGTAGIPRRATRWRCGSPCPAWIPSVRPSCWPGCKAPPPCRSRMTRTRTGSPRLRRPSRTRSRTWPSRPGGCFPAVSMFSGRRRRGHSDALFPVSRGVPARFAGVSQQEWAARAGGRGPGSGC